MDTLEELSSRSFCMKFLMTFVHILSDNKFIIILCVNTNTSSSLKVRLVLTDLRGVTSCELKFQY
jgi:hypothetical protein